MKKNTEKMCLHTFICLHMVYWFICVICFIPKKSFMFNFGKHFQQSTIFQRAKVQIICLWIYTISLWHKLSLFSENKKSPFLELKLAEKMGMSDILPRRTLSTHFISFLWKHFCYVFDSKVLYIPFEYSQKYWRTPLTEDNS